MSPAPQLDGWPAPPVPVEGCDECAALDKQRADAVEARDEPAETDARVLLRRHLRAAH